MTKKREVVETVTTKTVKKVKPGRSHSTIKTTKLPQSNMNQLMVENLVSLQKVMVDMTIKLDSLTNQMSKLLNLFEVSAKSFMEKQGGITKEDQEFLEKLDKLLEQNKTIAKGLTLMEERVREKAIPSTQQYQPPQNQSTPRQLTRF